MVCVGPPLLASPAGSSSGLVLQNEVPVVVAQLAPLKPHVVPVSMLCPPSAIASAGPQFPPEVLLASMLLVTVRVPPLLKTAPPASVAPLPAKVLLVTVATPGLATAMAPPAAALLPVKVLLIAARVSVVKMAPPKATLQQALTRLPEKVLLVTVRMPVPEMAPPLVAVLPEKVLLVTVRVPTWLRMAPP